MLDVTLLASSLESPSHSTRLFPGSRREQHRIVSRVTCATTVQQPHGDNMAIKLADYSVLFHGNRHLRGNATSQFLPMLWEPPKRFVAAAGRQRPYLTWQMWIEEPSGYQILLNDMTVHYRSEIAAGQVHTASHYFDGNALKRPGVIKFHALGNSHFHIEAVTMHFQQRH